MMKCQHSTGSALPNKSTEENAINFLHRLILLCFFTAYVLALVFATWDRLEMMVPVQLSMTLVLLLLLVNVWKDKLISFNWFDGLLCVGATYYLIRAMMSPVVYYGNVDSGLVITALATWLVVRNVFSSFAKNYWIWLSVLVVTAHLVACYYQYSVDSSWGLLRVRSSQAKISVSGLYGHYNYLANYLAMVACGILGLISHGKLSKGMRSGAVLIMIATVGCLIWTKSRGGFVALGSGSVVYLLAVGLLASVKNNKGRLKVIVGITVSLCLLTVILSIAAANIAVRRGFIENDGFLHDNGRLNNVIMAVDQIVDGSPIGSGARSYEWMSTHYWLESIWGRAPLPNYVHNEFLQAGTDYGPVGAIILLISLAVATLWSLRSLLTAQAEDVAFNLSGVAACAAFLTQCFVSFPAHVLANLLTFVVFLHMALYRKSVPKDSSKSGLLRLSFFTILLLTVSVTLTYSGIMGVPAFLDRFDTVAYKRADEIDKRSLLQDRLNSVDLLVEWRADFINLKRKGQIHWSLAMLAESEDKQIEELSHAADAYQKASEKYPWEPSLQMNTGLALDRLYKFDEAEEYFLMALKYGERADFWINGRWNLANHYYVHGRYLWMKRQPEKALEKFYQAREVIAEFKRADYRELNKQIRENITFLENTGIRAY